VEYSRLLDTNDTAHDRVITPSTPMYIIWSANVNQKPSSPSVFAKHTHRPDSVPITIDWSQPCTCSLRCLHFQSIVVVVVVAFYLVVSLLNGNILSLLPFLCEAMCIDSSDVVQIVIVLDISMDEWNANTFQNNMATTLNIPSYRINILTVEGFCILQYNYSFTYIHSTIQSFIHSIKFLSCVLLNKLFMILSLFLHFRYFGAFLS
jgi:hypothetical protein